MPPVTATLECPHGRGDIEDVKESESEAATAVAPDGSRYGPLKNLFVIQQNFLGMSNPLLLDIQRRLSYI